MNQPTDPPIHPSTQPPTHTPIQRWGVCSQIINLQQNQIILLRSSFIKLLVISHDLTH